MAHAVEAPASTTAEGQTSHTQNQAAPWAHRLTNAQIDYLLRGIDVNRIGTDGKGFAHVEAWDIRRHLIRMFGFGGHDTDLLNVTMISETSQMRRKTNRNGQEYGDPYEAWTVIYRVAVRLTVKAVDGTELGHWHGVATGDASNQPSRADAHDLALKTADSQAFKRAATNLGDQFGLSLYNNGLPKPVVVASLAYLKPAEEPKPVQDDPVQPEPDVAAAKNEEPSEPVPGPSAHLAKLMRQVTDCWKSDNVLIFEQIKADGEAHKVLDEEFTAKDGARTTLRTVLDGRIAELKAAQGGDTERSAA